MAPSWCREPAAAPGRSAGGGSWVEELGHQKTVVVDIAGAAIQADRPVVARDLEKHPAHALRARLRLEQREDAAADPALANLGQNVELVDAGLPPAGLDAEREGEDGVADGSRAEPDRPGATECLARRQRGERRQLPVLIEGVAVLGIVGADKVLQERQVGPDDGARRTGFWAVASLEIPSSCAIELCRFSALR
jgi:hypothetical protein